MTLPQRHAEALPSNRDVVVVGASAGGVEALKRLLASLPAELPAAISVVLHRGRDAPDLLADVLATVSAMPVQTAAEGQPLRRGQVCVAPPDRHLLVGRDHVHVRRGPRENGSRPAVDPLFRSAAANCTTRVIGVILSGYLNDGTAGLRAIKRCGGLALVQEPRDAAADGMPRSAIRHVAVDHVRPIAEMGALLAELTRTPRPPPPEQIEPDIRIEALIAAQEVHDMDHWSRSGTVAPITCPECHGALQEIHDGTLLRYRCHTGHAFTLDSLASIHADSWERALYNAYRAQQEKAFVVGRMAGEAGRNGATKRAAQLQERARSYEEGAELLRRLIAHSNGRPGVRESAQS